MTTLILAVHIFVAFFLIIVVLLQSGKGANIGATFGGSSQTVFGSRGAASFLGKITTASAILFMVTSLTLSVVANTAGKTTVVDDMGQQAAPAAPPSDTIDPFKDVPSAAPGETPGQTPATPPAE